MEKRLVNLFTRPVKLFLECHHLKICRSLKMHIMLSWFWMTENTLSGGLLSLSFGCDLNFERMQYSCTVSALFHFHLGEVLVPLFLLIVCCTNRNGFIMAYDLLLINIIIQVNYRALCGLFMTICCSWCLFVRGSICHMLLVSLIFFTGFRTKSRMLIEKICDEFKILIEVNVCCSLIVFCPTVPYLCQFSISGVLRIQVLLNIIFVIVSHFQITITHCNLV